MEFAERESVLQNEQRQLSDSVAAQRRQLGLLQCELSLLPFSKCAKLPRVCVCVCVRVRARMHVCVEPTSLPQLRYLTAREQCSQLTGS